MPAVNANTNTTIKKFGLRNNIERYRCKFLLRRFYG